MHGVLDAVDWTSVIEQGHLVPLPTLEKAAATYLKDHLDDAGVLPLRKVSRSGKPGPLDPAKVKDAIGRWLGAKVQAGEILELQFHAGRKLQPLFTITPAGYRSLGSARTHQQRLRSSALVERAMDLLDERLAELRAAIKQAEDGSPAALDHELREAYRRLDASGRGYVPIHRLRAAVGADRDRFDDTLRRLRRELAVDLQVGAESDYTPEQILASLQDSDGTLYLTLTWRR